MWLQETNSYKILTRSKRDRDTRGTGVGQAGGSERDRETRGTWVGQAGGSERNKATLGTWVVEQASKMATGGWLNRGGREGRRSG